jgi:hypothetical protein
MLLDSGFAPSSRALRGPVCAPRNDDAPQKDDPPGGNDRAGRVRHGVDEAPVPDAGSTVFYKAHDLVAKPLTLWRIMRVDQINHQ